jgi:excinuclease ABC subunit C
VLKKRNDLPEQPGIYIFKTAAGKALYIGKAVNLKKRVGQYFQKKDNPLLQKLLERAGGVDYIVTDAEADALLLEYNLVHTYQPPFNIRLKDDKSFPFIEISLADDFPGIRYSRQVAPGNFILGPLVSAKKTRDLIDVMTRVFSLRFCNAATFKKGNPCLYYFIDRCSAPCAGKIAQATYRRLVGEAVDFLKGRKGKIMSRLAARMNGLASELNFEQAQKIKEDLELIRAFSLRSYISTRSRKDYDVLVVDILGHESFFAFFSVICGQVKKSDFFSLPTVHTDADEILREFMLDFYRQRPLPGEIVISRPPSQAEDLERLFSIQAGRRIRIRAARRGEKKKILDLATKNLALFVQKSDYRVLGESIKELLRLRHFPGHIEGYDISHLGEKNRVGALVTFRSGRPEKRLYRSFVIRGAAAGDTGALDEVLRRRFFREVPVPDLLLIDGGLPQLGIARQVKADLGLSCDLVALAKEEERAFLEDGTSLVLEPGTMVRHLLQQVRDEAHRRAVAHHRKRREKLPG